MRPYIKHDDLPDSNSPDLELAHPTPTECVNIWTNSSIAWRDALDLPTYLLESQFLTTIPLAREGGMTVWVLVDKKLPPDRRPILCSSESFRKRAFVSDAGGKVQEGIVHGVASVFCQPEYRRRGYAARHMEELARVLRVWQSDKGVVVGSVLYSDIGKDYYARLGWPPNVTNTHMEFPPMRTLRSPLTQQVVESDLAGLCKRDEAMIRRAMATPASGSKKRFTIIPDLDHLLWHIRKEDFVTKHLFGKISQAKGASAGCPGSQIWAIWTHRYYEHPDVRPSDNVLYILRLVVEWDGSANGGLMSNDSRIDDIAHNEQINHLEAVLRAAQAQAAEWQLGHVVLWEPSPWVHDAVSKLDFGHLVIERQDEGIASGLWYDELGEISTLPTWINNEYYAWC